MQLPPPGRQFGTFPLDELVLDIIGDNLYKDVHKSTAEVIFMLYKNKQICYVQRPGDADTTEPNFDVNYLGKKLSCYRIWYMTAWLSSSERWLKVKAWSQKNREERNIREANVRMLARGMLKVCHISPDQARVIAMGMLDRGETHNLSYIGVEKLFTKIEEIPPI